jgi:hypothetical protein
MIGRTRIAIAHGILAFSAVAIAVATGWYFLGTGKHVTVAKAVAPASAAAKPTASGARLAADAFVGSIKAGDAAGICALMSAQVKSQHPNCRQWARQFIGATKDGTYAVHGVALQPKQRARVRVTIDGSGFLWNFVHEQSGWRFESAAAEPMS